jgi:hypothetical protein
VAELTLQIGGLRAAIVPLDPAVTDVVLERYAGFLCSPGRGSGEPCEGSPLMTPPDWRLAVGRRPCGRVRLDDVVVRPLDGAGRRFECERHDFRATLDLDAREGEVELGAIDAVALDTMLRVVYSLALLERGTLAVHASSVVRDDAAYLFPGRSGAGKTTVTRLSPDATLLSDEISLVEAAGACHGSPFWGELARPGDNVRAGLRGIYFQSQADHHATAPLTRRQALGHLLPNVLFFAADPALTARVLDVAASLVAAVPCYRLSFRRDPGFWAVVRAAAERRGEPVMEVARG